MPRNGVGTIAAVCSSLLVAAPVYAQQRQGGAAPTGKNIAMIVGNENVIIVESVGSGTVGTKIVSTPTPVLTSEAFLQDEFGLVNPKG